MRLCLYRHLSLAVFVSGKRLVDFQFRNLHAYLYASLGLVQSNLYLDILVVTLGHAYAVVIDKCLGRFHQHHVAGDASIVPPVAVHRRHTVGLAHIVNTYHDEVIAFLHLVRNVEVEWCITADVHTQFFTVQVNLRLIVHGTEIQVAAFLSLSVPFEILFIPDTAFVEEEFLALRVPVARHQKGIAVYEVVFHMVAFALRLIVFEVAVGGFLQSVVVIAGIIGVGHDLPVAVERGNLTGIDIVQDSL